jgi:hypothetical protein
LTLEEDGKMNNEKCVNEGCHNYDAEAILNCDKAWMEFKNCPDHLITETAGGSKVPCSVGLSLPRLLADELFENCWTATSKLESQLMRNLELPEAYKEIIDKSFASLRKLDDIIKAR